MRMMAAQYWVLGLCFSLGFAIGCGSDDDDSGNAGSGGTSPGGSSSGGASSGGTTPAGGQNAGGGTSIAPFEPEGLPSDAVAPTESGGNYVLTQGDAELVVDPSTGARIVSFSLSGTELLTDTTVNADNYGSSLWTSPQSVWGWPPPAAFDTSAYAVTENDGWVLMTSDDEPTLGVRMLKGFYADPSDGALVLAYALDNTAAAEASHAAWEVTRVGVDGIAFFPGGNVTGDLAASATEDGGVVWLDAANLTIPGGQKFFAEGDEGWLAWAQGDLLFVKSFPNISASDVAPEEGEVEIYTDGTYVELEQQSAFTALGPGERLTWTVRWYVKQIDGATDVSVGSASLLAEARALVP